MLNKTILCGRLTANAELRQTQNGKSVVSFTLAVDRPYQKDKETEADFISCVAWGNTAEFIGRNFQKGSPMIVEGALRTRTYEDKNYPNVKHYATEVLVGEVNFVPKSSGQNSAGNNSVVLGNLDEFEEVIGDGKMPF